MMCITQSASIVTLGYFLRSGTQANHLHQNDVGKATKTPTIGRRFH